MATPSLCPALKSLQFFFCASGLVSQDLSFLRLVFQFTRLWSYHNLKLTTCHSCSKRTVWFFLCCRESSDSQLSSFCVSDQRVGLTWRLREWARYGVHTLFTTAEHNGVKGMRLLISPGQLLACQSSFTPGFPLSTSTPLDNRNIFSIARHQFWHLEKCWMHWNEVKVKCLNTDTVFQVWFCATVKLNLIVMLDKYTMSVAIGH